MSSSVYFRGMPQRLIAAGLCATLILGTLTGCSGSSASVDGSDAAAEASAETTVSTTEASEDGATTTLPAFSENLLDTSTLFSDRDLDPSYDEQSATKVTLADGGSSAEVSGVTVDGSTVTITEEGTYLVSGSLSDGQLIVDVADDAKVQIVLAGASITSSSSAGIYVRNADKVFLTLADGSTNTISTTGAFVAIDDNNIDGAIFSKDDLTINGSGSLAVSTAEGHGIVVKDDLTLTGGNLSVTASSHAIQAKGGVAIADGSYLLNAGKDGIHTEDSDEYQKAYFYQAGGSLDITAAVDGLDVGYVAQLDGGSLMASAGDDGIHAEYDLLVNAGTITVSKSYEGLEGARITVNGGDINVVASDDGFNASGDPTDTDLSTDENDADEATELEMFGSGMGGGPGDMGGGFGNDSTAKLTINGGTIVVDASGDGLDSNGDFTMTGGTVYVSGPTNSGNGALDFGDGATSTITGGTIVAAGAAGMAENFSVAENQGSMLVNIDSMTTGAITLADEGGNVLASYTPAKEYQSVVVSAPGVEEGGTYTLTTGTYETTVTMDSLIYGSGGMMGGMMGGAPGEQMGAMGGGPGGQEGTMGGGPGGQEGTMGAGPGGQEGTMGAGPGGQGGPGGQQG